MELSIKNFAKIKSADIIVDGITVIAGENNTGKSTVGKVLFSLFNSFSNIKERIKEQRETEIKDTCRMVLMRSVNDRVTFQKVYPRVNVVSRSISGKISEILQNEQEISSAIVMDIVKNSLDDLNDFDKRFISISEVASELIEKIMEILVLPEEIIIQEVISRYFSQVFFGQINSLTNLQSKAELDLKIKGKNISIFFAENDCNYFSSEINILNNAIYIDNPFVLDELDEFNELNTMNQHLRDMLIGVSNDDALNGVIGTVLAKEKLSEIFRALDLVVDGKIVEKRSDEFYLEKEGHQKPISVNNLSTGLKSFVIIKMLLEKGMINQKDVLILDEPEIHLHPQWQVAYAELIVLLQKYFDLSIIVTTHSPYFLDAINLFSMKHGNGAKVNYYLASENKDGVEMELVTDRIDLIYEKMSSPIQILDTLRYELNNER